MFDIVVLVLIGVPALLGLWKGLVRQVIGLAGVAAAYIVAMKFFAPLAARYLSGFRPATGSVVAFLVIFFACLIAASLIGWVVEKVVGAAGLGILNRIGGGILGGAKGYLIVSVVVMMLIAFMPPHSSIFRGSRTMKYIQPMAGFVSRLAPESIGRRYEERTRRMEEPRKPIPESLAGSRMPCPDIISVCRRV